MAKIEEMPKEERPREKAKTHGLASLSNRELLALMIRCGTVNHSALEIADDLLALADGIKGIPELSIKRIGEIKGLSENRALELLASLEFSKRLLLEKSKSQDTVRSPQGMYDWLQIKLGNEKQEQFLAVYLDCANHIISEKTLFIGTATETSVSPREIFIEALKAHAVKIMLVHNHPSGSGEPSRADLLMTIRILESAHVMGMSVLDHLIVTKNGVVSIRAGHWIDEELWDMKEH